MATAEQIAARPALSHPEINPWWIAVAVMSSTFMEVLDTTVVNVSLPHIAGSLSATVDEATWTLTSYLVANAIVLPITGWLGSFFGRKRLLTICVAGFATASFLCGLAPNLFMLIIFRIVQGAFGGGLQPISQAILLESFPPEDRGKAMAFWGLGIVVAPMLGPVLGGWLTDSYSWRWVFYINVPIGVLSLFMTQIFIFDPPHIRKPEGGIDYWGIGFLAVWIGALQVLLDKGQEEDWFESRFITALAVIATVFLVIFLVRELRTRWPVVNLQIFRLRTYALGTFLMSILGVGLYGSVVLIPLILQTLLGYPALQAGIAMAPRGFGSFVGMPLVGLITNRFDSRKLLAVGMIVVAVTLLQLSALNTNADYWNFFWPQFLMGLGLALVFVPLTTVTMDPVPIAAMGNATSLFNLVRNIGGSIGIAAVAAIQARREQMYINILGAHITAGSQVTQRVSGGLSRIFSGLYAGGSPLARKQSLGAIFAMLDKQARMLSYNYTFFVLGIMFFVVLPLIFFMKRPAQRSGPMAVH